VTAVAPDLEMVARRSLELLHATTGDAAHDVAHIRRVVANARKLAILEGARLEIVMPAAWLHDCVVIPKTSPDRPRASRLAAARAVELLTDWEYPAELLPPIAHAIEAHSFSAKIPPETLEARVVQDADRLDALGAIGLARTLMLGGAIGRPLYVEDDPFCEHRPPDDAASTIDHFYTKLLGLAETMQTTSAREDARERTAYLREFVERLRGEIA
jgi:uncharacterized protein